MKMPSRPAQGNNSGPLNRPRPAYKSDSAPRVVGQGTLSRPKSATAKYRGKRDAKDATPKVINL